MAKNGDKRDVPPYTSFTSFVNFINVLSEGGIPSRIDRSIMANLSGGQQSAIIAALKWFQLIDLNNIPTQKLSDIVNANKDDFNAGLREMLLESYGFMHDDGFDLSKATSSQLEEQFRKYGISGSTVTKCVQFFLSAAKRAGIPMSSHLKPPKTPRANGSSRRRSSGQTRRQQQDSSTPPKPPKDTLIIPIPLPGLPNGEIRFPANMSAAQWKTARKMAEFILETYTENPAEDGEEVR